jgi:alpha-mannosidase
MASGPVLARLKISGVVEGIEVATFVTIYRELDRVDFDIRIHKPVSDRQQRLLQVFPVAAPGAVERIETTGAIIRPYLQPEGDLVAGADSKRFAVQGFVDVSVQGAGGVAIAPIEAFALRRDLGGITFEALGNDQNYKEVTQNQAEETEFRFRYSLAFHAKGYAAADLLRWSRNISMPLMVGQGRLSSSHPAAIRWNPDRAVAVCLKPAEDDGVVLRLWETGGRSEAIPLDVIGYRHATETDLLERDRAVLGLGGNRVLLPIRPRGFATLRLSR